jgi:hypothetical protein
MKKFIFRTILVISSLAMMYCTKEGPVGPKGPAGQNGQDGNANVTTYFFTDSAKIAWSGASITFNYDSTSFFIPDTILNYGVVLVYHKVKGSGGNIQLWYPVPGLGYNAIYLTRLFIRHDYLQISAYNPDGSFWSGGTLPELTAVKIILIPATTVISMKAHQVDINSYDATMEYFGLEK